MTETTTFPQQINYKAVEESATPRYRLLKVPLINLTGNQTTITASTSQLLSFKLPTCVFNLSQSYLCYQVSLPAVGGVANWLQEDCMAEITNAYFGVFGGTDICNLNFVNRYTKVARKMKTKMANFLANDSGSLLYPSNVLAANNLPGVGAATVNYIEPNYTQTSGTLQMPFSLGHVNIHSLVSLILFLLLIKIFIAHKICMLISLSVLVINLHGQLLQLVHQELE